MLRADEANPLLDGHRRAVLLGESGPHTYFALDLSDLDDAKSHRALAGRGDFVGLRQVGPMLDAFDGDLYDSLLKVGAPIVKSLEFASG